MCLKTVIVFDGRQHTQGQQQHLSDENKGLPVRAKGNSLHEAVNYSTAFLFPSLNK